MEETGLRSPARLVGALVTLLFGALAGPVAGATALPPSHDAPAGAAAFEPFAAENGTPRELQAVAELAEATPDPGVPRCLGRSSFARTVWYRIPPQGTPQEITVEAVGRTLDVIDLAAFVQPETALGPLTTEPNACSGVGSGGADASEEPTSAVTLRVPALRAVLIQVGRRGRVGSADDERAVLSLDVRPVVFALAPAGDIANSRAPLASGRRANRVGLAAATVTEEDPAQPPCPSLGTVWRRIVPGRSGRRLISVEGRAASALAVVAGSRPIAASALDCINRTGYGALQLNVPVRRGRPLSIRIGTDRPPDGSTATLHVKDGAHAAVIDGGPGGFDPTTGGPGGGFPAACIQAKVRRARIRGARISGIAIARNRRRMLPLVIAVRRASVCDVKLELVGPRRRLYALARVIHLKGRRVVRLRRIRRLVAGAYRLRATAVSVRGERVRVRTRVRGRLG
jgi:hypothetical protein